MITSKVKYNLNYRNKRTSFYMNYQQIQIFIAIYNLTKNVDIEKTIKNKLQSILDTKDINLDLKITDFLNNEIHRKTMKILEDFNATKYPPLF